MGYARKLARQVKEVGEKREPPEQRGWIEIYGVFQDSSQNLVPAETYSKYSYDYIHLRKIGKPETKA